MAGTQASNATDRPVLYHFGPSSAAYRARIALALKGVDYEPRSIDLIAGGAASPDYRALNPQGLIPMLAIDGYRLNQSLAIIDYLDARFPEPPFVPKDPAARSHVLAMALIVAADIHPLNNLRVLKYLKGEFGADDAARDAWYARWVRDGFAALEEMAEEYGGTYLCGDTPGIADICLVPQMFNARRFKVSVDDFPTLVRIDAALTALEPFKAAHPDRFAAP